MEQKLAQLKDWLDEGQNIVFFGGAGVSTESGIPDFRSADGLYQKDYHYPPEQVISHSFFKQNPSGFYEFYKENMVFPDAQPNPAHLALARLEERGKLTAVITQNIDGLHQKGGSKTVYELHGSVHRNACMKCKTFYDLDFVMKAEGVPYCPVCGGIVKPQVVLYEESLDDDTVNGAVRALHQADVLIVGGTSLTVYPAAGLLRYYQGKRLILINKSTTSYDSQANLTISAPIGEVLGSVVY